MQEKLTKRTPIVVVMGHIDHGKSQLLDYIRNSSVVAHEAGGITQHVGAYEADYGEHKITFIDTPGHEAFSKMRSRGAKVADIAVLVVAADEGVKPQTLEAHRAIEAAGIPFIVALNKIDKPASNVELVKSALAEQNILVESYGGKIPSVNISAVTGENIKELLDTIILMAELAELKGNPGLEATGVVIESHLDHKKGIAATLLVQNGTIKKGGVVVAGEAIAPVRILENFLGEPIDTATFSSPVRVTGWSKLPETGTNFNVFKTKREAEEAATAPGEEAKREGIAGSEGKLVIAIIIKADASGSLEAVEYEMEKLNGERVIINTVKSGIGNIGEADIKFALGVKNPVILGFNVSTNTPAKNLAEQAGIKIIISGVIYKLGEELAEEIKLRESLIEREEITGTAKILKVFSKTKKSQVVGGRVVSGIIAVQKVVTIKRRGEELGRGRVINLEQSKVAAKEAREGEEFGAMIECKIEIVPQDEIEIFEKV